MKLWKKHRHNPEPRLIKCLKAEAKQGDLVDYFGDPLPRTQEIVNSAIKVGMERARIEEILKEVLNQ